GDSQEHGLVLHDLSVADLRQGRNAEARAHCAESLRRLHEVGAVVNLPMVLDQTALIAGAEAEWERAARLLGAAEGLGEAAGLPLSLQTATQRTETVAAARSALGPDAFAAAFAEGKGMDLERAMAYARGPSGS